MDRSRKDEGKNKDHGVKRTEKATPKGTSRGVLKGGDASKVREADENREKGKSADAGEPPTLEEIAKKDKEVQDEKNRKANEEAGAPEGEEGDGSEGEENLEADEDKGDKKNR